MAKRTQLYTDAELTELWRPRPDFIGPSIPPMIAWQRRGEPKDAWQIAAESRFASANIAADLFAWWGARHMTREPTPTPAYDPALEAPRYDDSKEIKWIDAAHKGEAEPEPEQQPIEQEQERK